MTSFISEQQAKYPDHASIYEEFGRLHAEKLWFELTEAIYAFVVNDDNSTVQNYVELYKNFVCTFADDINQLRLVQICSKAVQQQCPNGTAEEYAAAQQLLLDLCNTEHLVLEHNRVQEVARRLKEQQREDAALPPAQRKKAQQKRKEDEKKAKAAGDEEEGAEEDPVLKVEKQKASKLGAEALFVLQMETAISLLRQDFHDRAKVLIDNAEATISSLDCADPFVHASLYRAKADFHKLVGPSEQFFWNALRMSAYTPPDALSPAEKVAFAKHLSLSAITGDGIYNFGEVVALPVFESLKSQDECVWLLKLMLAFKSGNMAEFDAVRTQYASDIASEPVLKDNAAVLREKMALLCLVELVFLQNPEARNVTFDQVAQATCLPLDKVELLIMRAMSVGLIKGTIDEVEHVLQVSWLKPRVLDREQITELGKRFAQWQQTVKTASILVKENSADVFA